MTLGWLDIRHSRAVGLSDDQERDELRALQRFTAAIAEMTAAIEDVNSSSVLVEIEPSAFEDFLNDECPSAEIWAEKVRDARG